MNSKVVIVLNVLLLGAVVFLLVDRFSSGDSTENNSPVVEVGDVTTGVSAEGDKPAPVDTIADSPLPIRKFTADEPIVAWVDIDSISNNYELVKELSKEVTDMERSAQGRMDAKRQVLMDMEAELQRKASYESMAAEAQQLYAELQEEAAKAERFGAQKAQEIQELQLRNQLRLLERVNVFIKKYAEDNGIDYIITRSGLDNSVLYGSSRFDVTAAVINGLNEEYNAPGTAE